MEEESFAPESVKMQKNISITPREPVVRQLLLVGGVLLLIFGGGIYQQVKHRDIQSETAVMDTGAASSTSSQSVDQFANITITAKAAFVFDTQTQKVLYTKNADESLPLASLTKLMTATLAYEVLADTDTVTITPDAIWQDGNSGFEPGDIFTRQTLSDLTLQSSSNDGAFALAVAAGNALTQGGGAAAFVKAMNIKASELSLTNTYFRNPTGLDVSATEAGAYGSARDMAFLMQYIITTYPNLLQSTTDAADVFQSQAGLVYQSTNTNHDTDSIPRLIGSKTGYTDLAGGNLTVAFDASVNHPIIVVVLGSTYSKRFTDVETLVTAAMHSVQ